MKYDGFAALLNDQVERFHDRTALYYAEASGPLAMSYAELMELVVAKRDAFKAKMCTCVGLYAAVTPDWIATMFGAVLSGKRTVLLDLSQSVDTAKALIAFTGIDELYCTDEEDNRTLLPYLRSPQKCTNAGEGQLLFFTSGTTELNKAVVLSSRALCSSAWNGQQMLPCCETDTVLCMLPLNHVFGFVCSMLWPLSQGASVALGRGMRHFIDDPNYFHPTIISAVPSLAKYLYAMHAFNSKLKTVLIGASPCDADTLSGIRALGVEVRFGYGLTETASGLAISKKNADPFAMALCPDTAVRIAEDGEILVRSTCMMEGYFQNIDATAAVLRNGELATGDLGYLDDDGCLHITGRKKDILILPNGTKVFLSEWEKSLSALLNTEVAIIMHHERIALVAVAAAQRRAELEKQVAWFNASQSFDRQIVDLLLTEKALPRTPTGKLKRWAIKPEDLQLSSCI